MTAVIILNWNGDKDTIACLASLFQLERQDFIWVLVDNGSEQVSIDRISDFLKREQKPFVFVREGEDLPHCPAAGEGIFYTLTDNNGFAKGNNLGIELVERFYSKNRCLNNAPSCYLLLNNDTEQEPDFLRILEDFSEKNPQYVALTPQIRYGKPSELIWNCGGRLFFGFRRYYYGNKKYARICPKRSYMPVTLLTGCALFFRRELLGEPDSWLGIRSTDRYPRLLSERFFVGEEDFDFCMKMQKEKRKMACVLSSIVYHKQGSSQNKLNKAGRLQLYYLHRFVNVRQHFGKKTLKYKIWKFVYMPYVAWLFRRSKITTLRHAWSQVRALMRKSEALESVSKEMFFSYLQ